MERFSSLAQSEAEAAALLAEELKDHVALVADAFDLMGLLLSRLEFPTPSASSYAMVALGLRLANDLHCAERLATTGYPAQALTLVATMYEAAWALVFIGCDDALAAEWRDHDSPITPFRDARFLTREGLVKLGRSRDEAERKTPDEYRLYSQLKMGAHANPLLEKNLGITRTGKDILKGNGPDTSDDGIRAAWFAMLVAVHLSWVAMTGLVQSHLTGKVPDELIARLIVLHERHEKLGARFAEKWNQGDPYPGKWKK